MLSKWASKLSNYQPKGLGANSILRLQIHTGSEGEYQSIPNFEDTNKTISPLD
jgi:hypothetical protein